MLADPLRKTADCDGELTKRYLACMEDGDAARVKSAETCMRYVCLISCALTDLILPDEHM